MNKMASRSSSSSLVLLLLLCYLTTGDANGGAAAAAALRLGYYSESGSCPRAEDIVKDQVAQLYDKHGNTAVSWLRALFHDCMVRSCDASLLLETTSSSVSEKAAPRSFGMRNFKYIDVIKAALERECPATVSCADILALAARDGVAMLGGPRVAVRTGRRDSRESYYAEVERYIPNHNDSVSVVLSRFAAMGVDTEGTVALLGAHSVGRVHCFNLVGRLYPSLDAGVDPAYGEYLRGRCPTADAREDTRDVVYARNDRVTPMILDNMYYKNLLTRKGLLLVDQQLADDPRTSPFVRRMAADNTYFHDRFAAALIKMSENSPLTAGEGEVRKDCRFVNSA
ncbi:peroxidase 21 [Phragmites australis]|uniref:peroxidase 21 n=1 Tax=Phragmites australis TaxID=29695 RepID=UPI002D78FE8E|nr:peroxidase 21 [Phragmites australis]